MRKGSAVLVSVCTVALLAAGCGGGGDDGGGDTGPIKVGMIVSLTGNYSALGTEDQKGAELAVEEINAAGGVDGRQIELIVRDDKTAPDQAVLAYSDLRDQGIAALIGPVFSNCGLAVIPQTERTGLPYIALAPADEQVVPVRENVFMVPAKSSTYAQRLVEYLKGTGKTKIAVAHDTKSAYAIAGHKATLESAAASGVEVVADVAFDTQTQDFSPIYTRARSSAAQAVVVWVTGPPAVGVTKQFHAAELEGVELVLTGAQASPLFIKPAGDAAEGVTIAASIGVVGANLPDSPLKTEVTSFTAAYTAKYGGEAPQFAFDGYTAVTLLAEGLKTAGGTGSEEIVKALGGLKLLTPNGAYAYTADDHSGLSPANVAVVRVTGGTMTPVDWTTQRFATDLPS